MCWRASSWWDGSLIDLVHERNVAIRENAPLLIGWRSGLGFWSGHSSAESLAACRDVAKQTARFASAPSLSEEQQLCHVLTLRRASSRVTAQPRAPRQLPSCQCEWLPRGLCTFRGVHRRNGQNRPPASNPKRMPPCAFLARYRASTRSAGSGGKTLRGSTS